MSTATRAAPPLDERPTRRRLTWGQLLAVVIALGFAMGGALAGPGLSAHLTAGGFVDENAAAARAADELSERLGVGAPNLVVRVSSPRGVDDPAVRARAEQITVTLAPELGAGSLQSYWNTDIAWLKSDDGRSGLIFGLIPGDEDQVAAVTQRVVPQLTGEQNGIDVAVTGQAAILDEVTTVSRESLIVAELIALPITLLILLFVFGSVPAAVLPVALGGLCALASIAVLRVIASAMPVSVFALNLTTGLALGLAIDYSLLIVSRYRELVKQGHDYDTARRIALSRTRMTVAVSTATLALCLAGLLCVPLGYIRSVAVAGLVVITVTAFLVLTVLPVLLALLGARIDALTVRRVDLAAAGPVLRQVLTLAFRRPAVVAVTVLTFLGVLLLPFFSAQFGPVDDRVLPSDAATHQTADELRRDFPRLSSDVLFLQVPGGPDHADELARALSKTQAAAAIIGPGATYSGGLAVAPGNPAQTDGTLSALAFVPPGGLDPQELLRGARDLRAAVPDDVVVTGTYSNEIDKQDAIFSRLPLILAIVVATMVPMLLLVTGSPVVAVKTVVLTALSLTASFGVMVWTFQQGHLSWLLNFTPTGSLDVTSPVLLFCLAFGLAMDYQIMLLARIREEYDRCGDTATAVRTGVERTSKLLSAGAILVAVVFFAIGSGGTTIVKLLGIGLAVAVLVDAFVVRVTLVPAAMLLLGRWNWWAPRWLRVLHARLAGVH
ncbi:MMPL family transporter [Nocardia mangyaensis]|uniref:MMPL family transporter n=1 Tax=Nocardia mangyaensis TaxID=2213200 RepID=UPI00267656C6|nr:MMPL family transporter [Nocardia mangyaensis]MDO3645917.1 MMPL family transporter [Nocardia mangyaensis]